jgi:hypothetical protein
MKAGTFRSRAYREYVSKHWCVVCQDGEIVGTVETQSQAAHLRGYGQGGMGLKPSDRLLVPLCPLHHNLFDGRQKPGLQGKAFWKKHGIDPLKIADKLWESYND